MCSDGLQLRKQNNLLYEDTIKEAFDKLPDIIKGLSDEKKEIYLIQLQEIQQRYQDPEFRLAVIGNFSSGKSTFLNALIGRELLAVSDLPATAIPTYIKWNKSDVLHNYGITQTIEEEKDPVIIITMMNDQSYALSGAGFTQFQEDTGIVLPKDIGERLDYVTTTSSLIGKVKKIDVSFPGKNGFDNFCIIDTPGINPGDEDMKDHIVQTQTVLKNEADAAIVLYTAKDAMSKDTRKFMEDNAVHLMDNAIIVLTKMDLVPEAQKDKLMRNTTRLIQEQFHQPNPHVYQISAGEAVEYLSGRASDEQAKNWSEQFECTILEIMDQMRSRRIEIVSARIVELMTNMMDAIVQTINAETDELEKEKRAIDQASVKNLEAEFNKIYKEYKNEMKAQSTARAVRAETIVKKIIQKKCRKICKKISQASNQKELNQCLNGYYNKKMNGTDRKIIKKMNKVIMPQLDEMNAEYVKKAEASLEKYNRYLGKINSRSASVKSGTITSTSLSSASENTSSFLNAHAALIAAAGIAVLIPGLNLLILTGGWLWDAVRLDSKKKAAEDDVKKKLNSYKEDMIKACKESIAQTEEKNLRWAKELLGNYKKKYQSSFVRAEQLYHQHKDAVEKRLCENKNNSRMIESLKDRLSLSCF